MFGNFMFRQKRIGRYVEEEFYRENRCKKGMICISRRIFAGIKEKLLRRR